MQKRILNRVSWCTGVLVAFLLGSGVGPSAAQTGTVEGMVTNAAGDPLSGVHVTVSGLSLQAATGADGRYTLARVPVGEQVILFRWLGYQPQQATVTVVAGRTHTVDVTLSARVVNLGEIIVEGASRTPERIVEAPAAISVISPLTLRNQAITAQAPAALAQVPGVDIVQSGMNDYNVNARGFNSSLNRRILVLQDGRDLALAFLGSQEWNALSMPLDDISRLEVVRGPGSALYGANAFSGVINITTPPARDVVGTKISLGGGELSTFRGDFRHAGVSRDGRFGYRFNAGYSRSDTFSRSRTAFDGSDALAEYRQATDAMVVTGVSSCSGLTNCLPAEALPLAGQTIDPATGIARGDRDDLQSIYGAARFDYYANDGSMLTVEGGASQVENEVAVTGIGRVQIDKAIRPWARINWAADRYNISAWYTGRNTIDPQRSLASGLGLEETSALLQVEAQVNQEFANGQGRVVFGGSYRNTMLDTKNTLMLPQNDDRSDDYYSGYGQVEFRPIPQLRLVAAARVDDGTLFDTQFSPKGAIVYSPTENHSFRVSVNRAFQTPNYSEFFLYVPAGAPQATPGQLEAGVEAFFSTVTDPATVGPALAGAMAALNLPTNVPWNFGTQTPILALGNDALDVEKVTGWEAGYKGSFADNRAYVSVDFYFNRLSNFVTDLLPGVNQRQYPSYSLRDDGSLDVLGDLNAVDAVLAALQLPANHPLRVSAAQLIAGFQSLSASAFGTPALATLPDGTRAIVVSYANAGRVDEKGIEVGVGYGITPEIRLDASYTFFDFDVKDAGLTAAGQDLIPNTPQHKGSAAVSYTGEQGFDASVSARFVEAYDWAAGVFAGSVPSSQFIDVSAGYRINNNVRLFATATNLLDQDRFQLYGGSVIGRRVLGGLTATF